MARPACFGFRVTRGYRVLDRCKMEKLKLSVKSIKDSSRKPVAFFFDLIRNEHEKEGIRVNRIEKSIKTPKNE